MPAVTPFTMEDVVNGVLTQMRFAPGRDVQIHLQDGIKQDANILYRTLMKKFIWRDFISLTQITTDAVTGAPNEDMSLKITTFSDIAVVFGKNSEYELPVAPALINPAMIRQPTLVPIGAPKIFAIYPVGASAPYTVWSRLIKDTDYELDDPVPFYKDILVLGTAHLLCLKSGVNAELTGSLKAQFEQLVNTYRMDEVMSQYSTKPIHGANVMTDWFVKQ